MKHSTYDGLVTSVINFYKIYRDLKFGEKNDEDKIEENENVHKKYLYKIFLSDNFSMNKNEKIINHKIFNENVKVVQ